MELRKCLNLQRADHRAVKNSYKINAVNLQQKRISFSGKQRRFSNIKDLGLRNFHSTSSLIGTHCSNRGTRYLHPIRSLIVTCYTIGKSIGAILNNITEDLNRKSTSNGRTRATSVCRRVPTSSIKMASEVGSCKVIVFRRFCCLC